MCKSGYPLQWLGAMALSLDGWKRQRKAIITITFHELLCVVFAHLLRWAFFYSFFVELIILRAVIYIRK